MANDLTLFVGTYTRQGSAGIYTGSMNLTTGAIDIRHITAGIENPSFVAVDPTGEHLYSVCETSDPTTHGAITAFEINGDGSLRELNRQSTGGPGPCHLTIDATDQLRVLAKVGEDPARTHPFGAVTHEEVLACDQPAQLGQSRGEPVPSGADWQGRLVTDQRARLQASTHGFRYSVERREVALTVVVDDQWNDDDDDIRFGDRRLRLGARLQGDD